jgi:hypothetical protein
MILWSSIGDEYKHKYKYHNNDPASLIAMLGSKVIYLCHLIGRRAVNLSPV